MKNFAAILLLLGSLCSCSWENEETLYPESEICDTISVSFSEEVLPILTENCFACHSNVNAQDFAHVITLEDYEDIVASAPLIVGAINQLDGYPAMPKDGEKLDTCLINKFEAWVNSRPSANAAGLSG